MAGGLFSRLKSRLVDNTIVGADDDAEFDNIINNLLPTKLDDYSLSNAQMQSTADPYPGGTISLSTTLAGELERLRYVLKQQHVTSQWHIFPDIKNIINSDSPFSATQDHRVIKCDATSGAITVNLPAVSGLVDKILIIKKTDSSANAVTIDGNAAETIDGATTKVLSAQYDFIVVVADGVNWQIIAGLADSVVTLAGTQTLTNKTLTTPTLITPTSDDLTLTSAAASPPDANTIVKDNIVKGWVNFDGTGTISTRDSYNVSSITDDGVGLYTVTWDTDFAINTYATVVTTDQARYSTVVSILAGSCQVSTRDAGATLQDAAIINVLSIGDQ